MIKEAFVLVQIKVLLEKTEETKLLFKIALCSGYHQIRMDKIEQNNKAHYT